MQAPRKVEVSSSFGVSCIVKEPKSNVMAI